METPPFEVIIRTLSNLPPVEGSVPVPLELLKTLLTTRLKSAAFNEEGYLAANPDVESAIRRGEVPNAQQHYVYFGYFENRVGATKGFDEVYYVNRNPDVYNAIRKGLWTSGKDHYEKEGKFEWRSPNSESEDEIHMWRVLLEVEHSKDAGEGP